MNFKIKIGIKTVITLITVIILFIVLSGCSYNTAAINNIEITNLSTKEKTSIDINSHTTQIIREAIKKCKKADIANTAIMKPAYNVVIGMDNGKEKQYEFCFDYQNKSTYLIKGNNVFKVKDYVSKKFYLNDDFAGIYINELKPEIQILHKDKRLEVENQYDWTYKKINNSIAVKKGDIENSHNIIYIRDKENFSIKFDDQPDTYIIKLYENNEVVKVAKTFSTIFEDINTDGQYYIELEASWKEKLNKKYYGTQTVNFIADLDLPAELAVLSKDNYPGNALSVFIKNTNKGDSVKLYCTATNEAIQLYPYEDGLISIIPISLDASAGEYEAICIINEGTSEEYRLTKQFRINEKSFKTQYLEVSTDITAKTRTQEANAEYVQYVKAARKSSSTQKLWVGKFIMPIEGVLTTDFGEIRYVNNEKSFSRHSGIDLAAQRGTKIKASNSGKVVLAQYVTLTGNTIVIDHGMGLFTTYYHLDSMDVKAGDIVEKGKYIGAVGSTGFSTGPHLHFTFSIYNSYVNSYQPIVGLFE